MTRLAIIGAGAWGTALAIVARRAGSKTKIWARDPAIASAINEHHENPVYLPDIALDPAIAAELFPARPTAVLSGPSFAREVARDLPTAVVIASRDPALARYFMTALGSRKFRPYLSEDPIGTEIGGAVKNVLAIACGIVDGLRLGDNARAALITRGLAEMARFGLAKGARPETFAGLSGLGDLVLTCSGAQSRDHALGVALAEGKSLDATLAGRRSVVEGV